jgi:prepilin-type processing-associated H-X9-DG protein
MYTQDYDEQYPYNYHYDAVRYHLWWFQDDIRPYIKSEDLYKCPSASPHFTYGNSTTGFGIRAPGLPNPLVKDYNGNVAGGGFKWPGRPANIAGPTAPMTNNGGTGTTTRGTAQVEDVAGTILVFDCGSSGYQFEIWDLKQTHCAELGQANWLDTAAQVKVGTRHTGGFIAIFADGHAKWLPGPEKVKCGMWSLEAGD